MKIYDNIAVSAADILLPAPGTDMKKWAVIACDQYTSEPEYWEKADSFVGTARSSLRIVLPEVYLGTDTEEQIEGRLQDIRKNIDSYISEGAWDKPMEGFILTDRSTPVHPSRKGIVLAVDLEQYSFEPGNKEKIRATEGTVLSRIPPRVKIRSNAKVELPHIMLLIDDPEDSVIGSAWDKAVAGSLPFCYDTDLMGDAGHIKGVYVESSSPVADGIVSALEGLLEKSADGMLFAVGDGNHSLASAKKHWENIRESLDEDMRKCHPARFALAEVVNIHDKGLDFEPIHRVVFNMTREKFLEEASVFFKDNGMKTGVREDGCQVFTLVNEGEEDLDVSLANPPHSLSVGSVQMMLDNIGAEVDYIHGEDSVRKLSTKGNTGILLPDVGKDSFFDTIAAEGVFPRKTFSMGEAFEKRFYLEAKRIDG